jgi:hypothetical protein
MSGLVLFESALDALAECKSVDEVKGWTDRAAATQAYARMAKDKRLEVDAAEIRIRAERRLGEMLAEQKASGNMAKGHKFAGGASTEPPAITLAEAGIDKKLSSRAQKLAAVPEKEFEAEVDQWRDRVEAECERVSARLEVKGAAATEPDSEPEAPADDSDLHDRLADLAHELEALTAIVEADDRLKEAAELLRKERAAHRQTRELYDNQRLELATITNEAKRWRKKFEALEKSGAK